MPFSSHAETGLIDHAPFPAMQKLFVLTMPLSSHAEIYFLAMPLSSHAETDFIDHAPFQPC
jgi:hypothetical protein